MTNTQTPLLNNPCFSQLVDELSFTSDKVWLAALAVGVGFTYMAAFVFPFSESGKVWAYAGIMLRTVLYLWASDSLKGKGGETIAGLFAMGVVAGHFELLVDWGLINWTTSGQLVYLSGNDVVLLGSPIWMPMAWACLIVELSYPAIRLFGVFRKKMQTNIAAIIATVIAATSAAITVGFYEVFAYRANWWKYEKANVMIGEHCAVYIPLGEFLMFLTIIPITAHLLRSPERKLSAAIIAGLQFAVAIGAGYAIAYYLLEV